MATILLHKIAHARAGDKGNRLNISLIAYEPANWPILLDQVTEERVHELFRHRGATKVTRYSLTRLQVMNFVIDDVFEGGVNSSLSLDSHGKSNSFRLLSLEITVPDGMLGQITDGRFMTRTMPSPQLG